MVELRDGKLVPNAGVLPYDLNTPLFTDYAHKLRTVWMPKDRPRATTLAPESDPVAPSPCRCPTHSAGEGDAAQRRRIFIALADLELAKVRLVETCLLVRRKDVLVTLPYVWKRGADRSRP